MKPLIPFLTLAALAQAPPAGQLPTVIVTDTHNPGDIPDVLSDYTISGMMDYVNQIELELRGQYALAATAPTPGPPAGETICVRAGASDNRVQVCREAIEKPTGRK